MKPLEEASADYKTEPTNYTTGSLFLETIYLYTYSII